MTIGVACDTIGQNFLQDVVVQLFIPFTPGQRRVGGGHVSKCSIIHKPGRSFKFAAELTHLVLVAKEVWGEMWKLCQGCTKVDVPGFKPGREAINAAFLSLRRDKGQRC